MILSSTSLIIILSSILFLAKLWFCPRIYPDIFSNDFHGYIELGKNIFERFDFTVRWQLDNPVKYPPLFSILIYAVTLFTGDPIVSIQYINAFSTSFGLVPLFLLVKKMLNSSSAFLAAIFATYYWGIIRPCYVLRADYFFGFLTIMICWVLWEGLNSKNQKAWHFGLTGGLISLAYLTKYVGMLFCLSGGITIFYFFFHRREGIKSALKMTASLILGFLPLFIIYQLAFLPFNNLERPLSIGTYTFYDGNNWDAREGDDTLLYSLNATGTEFNHRLIAEGDSVLSYCLTHPTRLINKYVSGLKNIVISMSQSLLPFIPQSSGRTGIFLQFVLIFLPVLTMLFHQQRFKAFHVLLFVCLLGVIPLVFFTKRYLIPFLPLYFVLWLLAIAAFYDYLSNRMKKNAQYGLKCLLVGVYIFFVAIYAKNCFAEAMLSLQEKRSPYQEYLDAASWIKNDSKFAASRPKIMARKTAISYLTDSAFIALPSSLEWGKIVRFALSRDVNYIVLDKKSLRNRSDQWRYLVQTIPNDLPIRLAHKDQSDDNVILIYKIYY